MSSKYSLLGLVLSLTAVIFVSGCAGPKTSSPEQIQRALAVDTVNSVDEYILGATDVVRVSVWRNEDLSISVPIRPDGKISVPLVGDVQASGRTPDALANDIETKLSAYIREPQVSIVVTSMGSHEYSDRVRVTGAVQQPTSVPHRAGMTVLDMVLTSGGVTPFASPNNSVLYRAVGGEVVAIPVKLDEILSRGDISTNYKLRPGDILTIPERSL
ncbi:MULTISPECIES: XrtA/PEP-CTERM system exopolysaccharide export protein [unclassified Marinobacter]|jgi:polysaccharide export outer membrane protein|uniref:XrtA/PEP-CTERM system exopolysaccharide export protein n=1 Tax=unclassified Marinobacter TaxID=83889 RepID=UPI000C385E4D|nr:MULTISPECIES: XrtA/PEP-CTERM system exopolysaccharide export protein [unclassified Marinobacter]MAB50831.1 sugar ABC transporter substrate-binding protein [Marinobacter sp.]MAY34545.1 sugar ABC transporter substrate-binding protein [Spongiibacteraceae bacterium]|tara:strand:+ start:761 stop:1405 length:645 start_codon:yes stop_codon:yes gene_type:complete